MISNTAQNNTFTGGMNLDTDLSIIQNNQYREAYNIKVITNDNGTTAAIQNLEKSKKYNLSQNIEGTIVASISIRDIGVVISYFYKVTPGDAYYNVYRLENFDNNTLTVTKVLSGVLGLNPSDPISVVGNVETDNIYKIYFTDGNTPILILNIFDTRFLPGTDYVDSEGYILDNSLLFSTPTAILTRPEYINVITGNLGAGKVAYCYQLFNVNGTQTQVSPISRLIHLAKSNTSEGSEYKGSMQEDNVGRGVQLQINNIPSGFERIRLIRIMFTENNSTPTIQVAIEQQLSNATNTIVNDIGNTVTEYTLEEFNSISNYKFKAKILAKKDNRLFAANITEDSWNPINEDGTHYDARAYRCNADGATILRGSINTEDIIIDDIDTYDLTSIPEEHDCINPFNTLGYDYLCRPDGGERDVERMYMYGKLLNGTRVLGGYGTNIEYTFITTNVKLGKMTDSIYSPDSFEYGVNVYDMNKSSSGIIVRKSISISEYGTDESWSIPDNGDGNVVLDTYASPYFANNFTGYRRDELYRFGIVFYNNQGTSTPVYWIGDIRMPSMQQIPIIERSNGIVHGKALGIRFNVKNVPDGAVSYEIVRCDKTDIDRSIIDQVTVDAVYNYKITDDQYVGNGSILDESIEYRPLPFFHSAQVRDLIISSEAGVANFDEGNVYGYTGETIAVAAASASNAFRITSPSICLSGEQIESSVNGATISYLGHYYSLIEQDNDNTRKNFASGAGSSNLYKEGTYTEDNAESNTIHAHFSARNPGEGTVLPDLSVSSASYLSKYFYYTPNLIQSTTNIIDAVYPPCIKWNAFRTGSTQVLSAYTVNVGDIQYTNYSMSSFQTVLVMNDEVKTQPIMGPAGPCIVVATDGGGLFTVGEPYHDDNLTYGDTVNCVAIGNVVIDRYQSAYGGNSYYNRSNSTYISTGNYKINDRDDTNIVYGGDTYIGLFDYLNTATYQDNDASKNVYSRHSVYSYIPMESDINLDLMSGDMIHRSVNNFGTIPMYMQLQPVQMGNYYTQNKPYYEYNDAYSAQNTSISYVPSSVYSKDNRHLFNRIIVSEAKVSGEVIDNWSSFRVANYIDVDSQHGEITNLYTFNNNLLFWQNSAVGVASVNERSLITDNNNSFLTLGTGGILSRFDYISNSYGSSLINNKTIINSDSNLYWYDDNRNEIVCYNGQLNSLSKEKYVQTYLNQNRNSTLVNTNMNAMFDRKYNEIWFKIFDNNIVFNEQIGAFSSFYNHLQNSKSLQLYNRNIVFDGNELYEINNDSSTNDDTDRNAKITIVVNNDYLYTKVFDNIRLSIQPNSSSISSITFITDNNQQTATQNSPVFDHREDTYRLPVPRQDNFNEDDNMSFPSRLRSKCMTETFNLLADDKEFKIPYITTTYRYSLL